MMPGMPFETEDIELAGSNGTVRAYKNLPAKSLRELWLASKVSRRRRQAGSVDEGGANSFPVGG